MLYYSKQTCMSSEPTNFLASKNLLVKLSSLYNKIRLTKANLPFTAYTSWLRKEHIITHLGGDTSMINQNNFEVKIGLFITAIGHAKASYLSKAYIKIWVL